MAQILEGVDEIWHLGDACDEATLDEVRAIQPRMTVVLGNNDFGLEYPMTRALERGGERFHLIHIQPRRAPADADWLMFGHTHRPLDVIEDGVHYFNPGSAGKANKGAPASVGLLTRREGEPFRCEIIEL